MNKKLIAFFLASLTFAAQADLVSKPQIKTATIRAYVTRFEGNLHVASNVYAIANDETLLIEDHQIKNRIQLKGNELVINLPESNNDFSIGELQNLDKIIEGQRVFVLSNQKIQFRKVKTETERTVTFIECRADIFCGPTLRINKKIISLFEARNQKGDVICINNAFQKKLPAIYAGNCHL